MWLLALLCECVCACVCARLCVSVWVCVYLRERGLRKSPWMALVSPLHMVKWEGISHFFPLPLSPPLCCSTCYREAIELERFPRGDERSLTAASKHMHMPSCAYLKPPHFHFITRFIITRRSRIRIFVFSQAPDLECWWFWCLFNLLFCSALVLLTEVYSLLFIAMEFNQREIIFLGKGIQKKKIQGFVSVLLLCANERNPHKEESVGCWWGVGNEKSPLRRIFKEMPGQSFML